MSPSDGFQLFSSLSSKPILDFNLNDIVVIVIWHIARALVGNETRYERESAWEVVDTINIYILKINKMRF